MLQSRKMKVCHEIRISENTTKFLYTNRQGNRSGLRISRVVSETLRLDPKDVRWFVMEDDDTVFVVENVVRILSKYDHNQYYYIGSSSESHIQNIFFSYAIAYGGGGFEISYPLAKELEKIQDRCIQRYPGLYGLLGAHPVTPLVSIHQLDVVDPIIPSMRRVEGLRRLFESLKYDTANIMQQSICYDKQRYWSISVSWGYVVQITRGNISPRELEMPTRTLLNWYKRADYTAYAFNTRPVTKHPCQKPFVYYITAAKYDRSKNQIVGVYHRHKESYPYCRWKIESPENISAIVVLKRPDNNRWQKAARRDCCKVLPSNNSILYIWVGSCQAGETSEM
ncbi:hypothetical protein K7X08_003625 [Anisodus acutangulus]|uniref:Fringe-like glycosyltransferase domain-containing protein n=1 Tax=Anisodus acutangulus TaxID=402998 RepID=A0A9Q1MFN9_9SOLA|nr:hypothetical protein K7X08_003625 [Anisodus acutangulus]